LFNQQELFNEKTTSMKRILLLFVILLTMGAQAALAQGRRISGKVLDETGQGLPGAGITVRGTSTGTVTDVDGNFQLDLPEGNNVLVVQSIGYGTQTVNASGATVTIRLSPASRELQGTVVTALALKREKRGLGYGTTTISGNDLTSANNFSALSAIQGKTAGVNITSSTGGPGGSTRVIMRGEKSLNTNNNALIVVDGIPISNGSRVLGRDERYQIDFGNRGNDIDPDDIESITVLKGAVASALYGEQGAAGAIMYTTKSGKGKSLKKNNAFSYSTTYTISDVLKLPDFQHKYGQGDLHGIPDDRRENFSWGLPFDGQPRPWGQIINGQQMVKPYEDQPDNVRSFFNHGKTWENNIQFGGANDKGNYFVSLNTTNNTGVIPHTFFDKYSIRFNGAMDLPNKMYSNITFNYINTYSRVEGSGQGNDGILNQLIETPRDIPIWELKNTDNIFNSMGYIDSNGISRYGYYGAYTANPYWTAEHVDNRMRSDHIIGSNVIGIRPNEHWDIFNRLGVDFDADRATLKIPKYDYLPFEEDYYSSAGSPQKQTDNGGYTEDNIHTLLLNDDLIANFNTELGKDFNLNVLGGANLYLNRFNELRVGIDDQTNGLVVPDYYNLNNNQGPVDVNNPLIVPSPILESRRVSLYGQASVDFRKSLFFELTGRNDWSSTLSPGLWSFFYPSASLSWVFTEQLKNVVSSDVLSYGKIRASYAAVGTGAGAYQNNPAAYSRADVTTGFGAIKFPFNSPLYGSTPGFSLQNSFGDPGLKPERTSTFEIGTELAFWNNRFSIDATYYKSRTKDLIFVVPLPPSSGFTGRVVNIGELTNNGVELQARITPVSTASGFKWEVYGTYTKNVNNVVAIAPGVTQLGIGGISGAAIYAQVGQPFGAFYATDLQTDGHGHVVVDSATGMPQIAANPVYKGSYQPDWVGSLGTNLNFRGFSFNMLFDTKQGGVFYSQTKNLMDFNGTAAETEDRDDQVYPGSVYQASDGSYVANDVPYDRYNYFTGIIPSGQHIVNGSYVKLREVSLGYKLPEKMLRRTFLGSAEVSIFGNNLAVWTSKDNKYTDPEENSGGATNIQGFEYSARLSLRNYGIRLGVTF